MKTRVLFFLFFIAVQCNAQNGFTLSVDYGLGRSYERTASATNINIYPYNSWSYSHADCGKTDLGIQYKKGYWILGTGIGYWIDGYTRSTPDNYSNINMATLSGNPLTSNGNLGIIYANGSRITETFTYPHIVIPLLLGYQFNLSKKLSITPYLGAEISNNRNVNLQYKEGTTESTTRVSNNIFNNGYKRTSWWASAQLDINYRIMPRWRITLGPHFTYMLTNIVKDEYYTYEQSSLKLYNITVNAGIAWYLTKERSPAANLSN